VATDYDKEKWVVFYEKAIFELERAKITGRIGDTRIELAARIQKLRDVPDLHDAELHAINEAHRILLILEGEEEQYAAEEKSQAIEKALRELRSIAPKIQKLK
jgi:hypothetical protein